MIFFFKSEGIRDQESLETIAIEHVLVTDLKNHVLEDRETLFGSNLVGLMSSLNVQLYSIFSHTVTLFW